MPEEEKGTEEQEGIDRDTFKKAVYINAKNSGMPDDIDEPTFFQKINTDPTFRKTVFIVNQENGMPYDEESFNNNIVEQSGPEPYIDLVGNAANKLVGQFNKAIQPTQENQEKYKLSDPLYNTGMKNEKGEDVWDINLPEAKANVLRIAALGKGKYLGTGRTVYEGADGSIKKSNVKENDEDLSNLLQHAVSYIPDDERAELYNSIDGMQDLSPEWREKLKSSLYVDASGKGSVEHIRTDLISKEKHEDRLKQQALEHLAKRGVANFQPQGLPDILTEGENPMGVEDNFATTVFKTIYGKNRLNVSTRLADLYKAHQFSDPELVKKSFEDVKQSLTDLYTSSGMEYRTAEELTADAIGKKVDLSTGIATDIGTNIDYLVTMAITSGAMKGNAMKLLNPLKWSEKLRQSIDRTSKYTNQLIKFGESIYENGLLFEANNQAFYGGKGEGFSTGVGEGIGGGVGAYMTSKYYDNLYESALGKSMPGNVARFAANRFFAALGGVVEETAGELLGGASLSDLDKRYFSSIFSMSLFSSAGNSINQKNSEAIFKQAIDKTVAEVSDKFGVPVVN